MCAARHEARACWAGTPELQSAASQRHSSVSPKSSDPSICGSRCCSCPGHSADRLTGQDAAHRCRPRPPGRSSARPCAWRSRGGAGEIRLHYLAPSCDAVSHGADGRLSYGGMEFANGPNDLTQPCPHHERAARCLGWSVEGRAAERSASARDPKKCYTFRNSVTHFDTCDSNRVQRTSTEVRGARCEWG